MDQEVAKRIGTSVAELKTISNRITVKADSDRFVLLSTAVILSILKKRFASMEADWKGVVKKSEKWFKDELRRTEPTIDGQLLADWVDLFTKQLKC